MLAVTGVTDAWPYFSHSFVSVAAWLVVSGVFSTGIIPACISAFSESVEEENKFLATSIAESGVNIGAFLGTPYIALIEAFGGALTLPCSFRRSSCCSRLRYAAVL